MAILLPSTPARSFPDPQRERRTPWTPQSAGCRPGLVSDSARTHARASRCRAADERQPQSQERDILRDTDLLGLSIRENNTEVTRVAANQCCGTRPVRAPAPEAAPRGSQVCGTEAAAPFDFIVSAVRLGVSVAMWGALRGPGCWNAKGIPATTRLAVPRHCSPRTTEARHSPRSPAPVRTFCSRRRSDSLPRRYCTAAAHCIWPMPGRPRV